MSVISPESIAQEFELVKLWIAENRSLINDGYRLSCRDKTACKAADQRKIYSLKDDKQFTLRHSFFICKNGTELVPYMITHGKQKIDPAFKEYAEEKTGFLGKGGFGKVKELQAEDGNRNLVIKKTKGAKGDIFSQESTRRELSTLTSLGQLVGTCYEADKEAHYIAMHKADGERATFPLASDSDSDREYRPHHLQEKLIEQMLAILAQVKVLHQKLNKVHLDLKPDNIFYDPKTKTASLIDFGAAAKISPTPDVVDDEDIEYCPITMTPDYATDDLKKAMFSTNALPSMDIGSLGIIFNEYLKAVKQPMFSAYLSDLEKIAEQMKDSDPTNRPQVDKIITQLTDIQASVKKYKTLAEQLQEVARQAAGAEGKPSRLRTVSHNTVRKVYKPLFLELKSAVAERRMRMRDETAQGDECDAKSIINVRGG